MDHFFVSSEGDVTEPDGYSVDLSLAVISLISGVSAEYAGRIISTVRTYMNFRLTPDEAPRLFLDERSEEAVERIKAFFLSKNIAIAPSKKANHEHELELLVPADRSTVHSQQIVKILRAFYQLLGSHKVGQRTTENPLELPGWHLKSEEERRESWVSRYPKRPYGWIHAGLRFRTRKRKDYLPLIEDPTGCGQKMTEAVIRYGCPQSVIAICITLEENGCRWREAAWLNALGWSLSGFGENVYTTNKFDAGEHAKQVFLSPEVLSGLIDRFETTPHPTRKSSSMMDYLRELRGAGDNAALRKIPLFPNSRGNFQTHRTFNGHWFRPAMEAWENEDGSIGLMIQSDISARRPTPHWYRHAEISRELEKAIGQCKGDADITDVCRTVCRSFILKTDQAKRYAAALMRRITHETQLRRINERRATNEARRKGVDVPIAFDKLELSVADRLHLALPIRKRAA